MLVKLYTNRLKINPKQSVDYVTAVSTYHH